MPKHYKFRGWSVGPKLVQPDDIDTGYDSGYESEGGTQYKPVIVGGKQKKLGRGNYSRARVFSSAAGIKKAVLDPLGKVDKREIKAKFAFFKTLYPRDKVDLIEERGTYRLIIPLISGSPYHKIRINTESGRVQLFLSAVKALKDCHEKGLIVCDLKEDNIHWDETTGKSYLIDGGLAVAIGRRVRPSVFVCDSEKEVQEFRKKYPQFAPECWATSEVPSTTAMDVCALGNMMENLFGNHSPGISSITTKCQDPDPAKRPTLDQIEEELELMLLLQAKAVNEATQVIAKIHVEFIRQFTLQSVEQHRKDLNSLLDRLSLHPVFRNAYKLLGSDPEIEAALKKKQQEIDSAAAQRSESLKRAELSISKVRPVLCTLLNSALPWGSFGLYSGLLFSVPKSKSSEPVDLSNPFNPNLGS